MSDRLVILRLVEPMSVRMTERHASYCSIASSDINVHFPTFLTFHWVESPSKFDCQSLVGPILFDLCSFPYHQVKFRIS
jgi:hypothetical protein